jgi:hypothetical protein
VTPEIKTELPSLILRLLKEEDAEELPAIGSTKSNSTVTALWLCAGGSETRILSRNQKDLGTKFPEVKDSIAALDVQDAIIDGEIVALDEKGRSSFQLLQGIDIGQLITEWTRDDRLRQPVFLGIREDKNAN